METSKMMESFANALPVVFLLIGAIVYLAFKNPTISGGSSRYKENKKRIVSEYSDGNGSSTWTIIKYSDGTGEKTINHYMSGEVCRTEVKPFEWDTSSEW